MKIVFCLLLCTPMLCKGLTDATIQLAGALSWRFENANTNLYNWTFPRNVQVSNSTYHVCGEFRNGGAFIFDLATTNEVVVASCTVGVALSNMDAQIALFETLVCRVSMPISGVVETVKIERLVDGDIAIRRFGRVSTNFNNTIYHRTFGNLYASVNVNTNRIHLGASAFALPILSSGSWVSREE